MLAVVCHDAGGAELVSSWVLQHNLPYQIVAAGPAKEIFKKKLGKLEDVSIDRAIEEADWVLTGTSYKSELEITAIELARAKGKKTVAFLDHWINYTQRFKKENNLILPDEIWVGDESAFDIARSEFPSMKIVLKSNPYFKLIKEQYKSLVDKTTDKQDKSILYLCSPIKELSLKYYGDEKYWGYTEEEAVCYFMDNFQVFNDHLNLRLRLHPSEPYDKYNSILEKYSIDYEISDTQELIEDIYHSHVVIGCNTMAMVAALIVGKRVISGLPPGYRSFNLPLSGIEHLSDLIKQYNKDNKSESLL